MTSHSLPPTQIALVQTTYAQPLSLQTIQTPSPLPGTAIIKILFAPVLSYAKYVYDGTRKYPYPTPFVPGTSAIGRIAALGPDATRLQIGQLVYVDCVMRSRDNPGDIFLMGLHQGATAGSKKLMEETWRNGTWAEYCRAPLESVLPFNEEILKGELGYKEADLATLGQFLVVYGGLRDIGLQAGETVIVTPATGGFGGAAVMVALAIGASVIAMGRSETALAGLASKFEGRVKTVKMTGDVTKDAEELKKASAGSIDAVFDIPPPMAAKSTHLKSCIMAINHGGRISLMGGIFDDVPIPYHLVVHKDLTLRGKWMYSRVDIEIVIRMVETGVLKIGQLAGVKTDGDFTFAEWKEAFDAADAHAGWGNSVMMKPSVV
jgi:D-arabinose 1-dehydrogenase-like Zn-dependent alcohol dehydrogenase